MARLQMEAVLAVLGDGGRSATHPCVAERPDSAACGLRVTGTELGQTAGSS